MLFIYGWVIVSALVLDAFTNSASGRTWPLIRAVTGALFYLLLLLPGAMDKFKQKRRRVT